VFDTIGGIPLHPLIVHAVVVLVPLASLLLLLAAVSPRIRHWAGILTPITATLALVMTPLGESWAETLPDLLAAAEQSVRHYLPPFAWDPVALFILGLPGFAVFGGLALVLYTLGRKPRLRPGRFIAET